MPTEIPRLLIEVDYYQAAQDYLRRLPLEHFMEATPQATQRSITISSFNLVTARRPDIQLFNELLVQYPLPRRKRPGQVVPDNMVVRHSEPIHAVGSYDVPLQPVGPFWVLEYVSKNSRRKDYRDNMRRYERELKVPYYLVFDPEEEEITLYQIADARYVAVPKNEHGRLAVPELEMEVGVHEGWTRFWFRGEFLRMPSALQASLDETQRQLAERDRQLAESELRRLAMEEELARLRALLAQQPAASEDS